MEGSLSYSTDTAEILFENNISVIEICNALGIKAKLKKAPGFDNIPYEFFKNDTSVSFLHILFNVCYETGETPSEWGKNGVRQF